MTIATKTIRLFGESRKIYQVCNGNDVVKIFYSREEAQAWISAQ